MNYTDITLEEYKKNNVCVETWEGPNGFVFTSTNIVNLNPRKIKHQFLWWTWETRDTDFDVLKRIDCWKDNKYVGNTVVLANALITPERWSQIENNLMKVYKEV